MLSRVIGAGVLGLLLPLAGACSVVGGGDSEPTPVVVVVNGTAVLEGTPTAGDVNYVRGLCRAINSYVSSLNNERRLDPTLFNDQPRLLEVAAPILEQFRKDLEDARPPDDLKRFHESLVNRVRRIARDAREGQLTAVDELSVFASNTPNQPQQIRARMEGASDVLPECTAFGVDNLFGITGEE